MTTRTMDPETLYRLKPLAHSEQIGGVWVACEWAACMGALVYEVDGARYRTVPGLSPERVATQVVDSYLDRAPFGAPHTAKVRSLVVAALPA